MEVGGRVAAVRRGSGIRAAHRIQQSLEPLIALDRHRVRQHLPPVLPVRDRRIGLTVGLRLHHPEMAIGPQPEQRAVHGGVEHLVAVALLDQFPVFLKDVRRQVLGVVPVPDAHAQVAVPQGLDQIVVVLQPLFLGQAQQVICGAAGFLRRLPGAAPRQQAGQQGPGQQVLPKLFHRVSPFVGCPLYYGSNGRVSSLPRGTASG